MDGIDLQDIIIRDDIRRKRSGTHDEGKAVQRPFSENLLLSVLRNRSQPKSWKVYQALCTSSKKYGDYAV